MSAKPSAFFYTEQSSYKYARWRVGWAWCGTPWETQDFGEECATHLLKSCRGFLGRQLHVEVEKRRENRRRRRRKVLWKPISLCPLPDLGPHVGSLTLSASPLALISDALRASVEGARKKLLVHCMVTKPWWGIKNMGCLLLLSLLPDQMRQSSCSKSPETMKNLGFFHVEEARETQFFALQGNSHTAQCSLGPGSAVLGPGRVWGALTCGFLCVLHFLLVLSWLHRHPVPLHSQLPCRSVAFFHFCSLTCSLDPTALKSM